MEELTHSERARKILDSWKQKRASFVKVFPRNYPPGPEKQARFKQSGLTDEEASWPPSRKTLTTSPAWAAI